MAEAHEASVRRELPLWPTSASRRTQGGSGFIPDDNSLHTSTTLTTRGRKQRSHGSIPPRTVWEPNPAGWLLIGWGSWSQGAARVTPLANVEVPPHPRRIGSSPRIRNPSISLQLSPTTWGRKRGSPGSILPSTVWKPQPHWLVADWLGLMEPAGGEGFPSGQGRGRAADGRLRFHHRIRNYSLSLQFQQTGDQEGDPTDPYRPTRCGNPKIRVRHC